MGRDKNELRRYERRWNPSTSKGGQTADWGTVDPKLLQGAIEIVAKQGGALRFGYTRDGGAYALGVYGDGEPYTVYIKPAENPDDYLRDLIEHFDVPSNV